MSEETREVLTLGLAVVALVISGVSLWISSLRPFKLELANSDPRLVIYGIGEGHTTAGAAGSRFIPSVDMALTFVNTGRQSGRVTGLRFLMTIDERAGRRHETYLPIWVVDYAKFQAEHDRFEWLNTAVIRDWYTTLVPGGEERAMHVVFEHRGASAHWTRESGPKRLLVEFQYKTSARQGWIQGPTYVANIPTAALGQDSWTLMEVTDESRDYVTQWRTEPFDDIDSPPDPHSLDDTEGGAEEEEIASPSGDPQG